MLTPFLQYLEAERRYSPLTLRNYRRDISLFFEWLGTDENSFDPTRITAEDIREWILHRTETARLGAASMNREVSSLRSFFRWLHRTGRTAEDICRTICSLKTPKRLPVFVPQSRMADIVHDCGTESDDFITERNALIVLMFYACGLRLAELVGTDRSDFTDDYTSLRVRGKGDKQRIVPVLDFVREKILRYLGIIERQNICNSAEKALFLIPLQDFISILEIGLAKLLAMLWEQLTLKIKTSF